MLDDLRKMHVSARHLLTLINDILDLAKIQAGKLVLDASEFDLPPLLAELEEWVEPLIRKNGNSLTVEVVRQPRRPAGRSNPRPAGAAQPAFQRGQVHDERFDPAARLAGMPTRSAGTRSSSASAIPASA